MFFKNLTPIKYQLSIASLIALCAMSSAAWIVDYDTEGGKLGNKVIVKAQAEVLGAYDNRAFYENGEPQDDFYSDIAAAAVFENHPSVYNWLVKTRYGVRVSAEEQGIQDDFYTLRALIGTEKVPFIWKLSADITKSLDYNTGYNPETGQVPDSILTDQANTRAAADANAEYEKKWFGKTSIVPGYKFSYYWQGLEDVDQTTEYLIHQVYLQARYQYSKKTRFAVGTAYSLQLREYEDGAIGTVLVGIDHQMTDKTSWRVILGYSIANYDLSGEDQGVVSQLRGNWQFTKKVGAYVFGGNDFLPGYGGGGGARWVYRLGYGARWQIVPKFSLSGTILHDYQQAIGEKGTGTSSYYDGVRNFIDLKADYRPVDPLSLIAGISYIDDDLPDSQTKVYLSAIYRFY